jgi:hypothetical protein
MFRAATYAVSDSDQYAVLLRGAEDGVVVADQGDYDGRVTCVDLDRLWMQRGKTRLFRLTIAANRVPSIRFSMSAPSPVYLLTAPLSGHELTIPKPGQPLSWSGQ